MGVDNYIYLVFDGKLGDVRRFIEEEFKLESWDDDGEDTWVLDLKRYSLLDEEFQRVASGELAFDPPLRTTEGERIINADFRIYSVRGYTILEIHPAWRSMWGYVLSSDLIRLLKKFMRGEPLLICGYRDDADLTKLGFKHGNRLILVNWLPEAIKGGKLEILPSGLTVVKNNLLPIEDGLYELVEGHGEEEKEYVLVKSLEDYKILVSVRESDLTDEECYLDLLEDKAWFSLEIVGLVFKRIGRKVEDEFLVKRAEEYFKAQVGEDGS
ncbi:hypothetical protein [Thermococcus sp.]